MRLPFLPAAIEELDWEVVNLEMERRHWGEKLYEEVRKRVDLAADHPELGRHVRDVGEGLDVRRFVVPKFGISVIVALVHGERTVIAIAPGRRSQATGASASRSRGTLTARADRAACTRLRSSR